MRFIEVVMFVTGSGKTKSCIVCGIFMYTSDSRIDERGRIDIQ